MTITNEKNTMTIIIGDKLEIVLMKNNIVSIRKDVSGLSIIIDTVFENYAFQIDVLKDIITLNNNFNYLKKCLNDEEYSVFESE